MKKSRSKKKIIIFVLAGIVLLLFIGNFAVNAFIQKKIRQMMQELSPAAKISFSSINANFLTSSLSINELSVYFGTDSLHQKHQHYFYVPHLTCKGVNFFGLASGKEASINSLQLEKCVVRLDKFLLDKGDSSQSGLLAKLPAQKITINHFEILQSQISVQSGKATPLYVEGDIVINKMVVSNNGKAPDAGGVRCNLYNCKYAIPDAYHTIHIKKITANSEKELVEADSVRITPFFSRVEFGKKIAHQVDQVAANIATIRFEKVDIMKMLDKELVADKILIRNSKTHIYRDRRLPRQTDPLPLPVAYLKSIPLHIRVKTFSLTHSFVAYEEFPKDGTETGTLKVEQMEATLTPLINHPGKTDPGYMELNTKGSLMGSGTVTATIKMPLGPGQPYYVKGAFHNMDLTTLDPPAENLGKIRIESGMLDFLSFEFNMTEEVSTGKIIGEYHNLVIDKLKEHTKDGEKKVDRLKSFALKHLIIPKNKDKTLPEARRTGKVKYERDPSRLVSYYLVQSLLTGIKASFTLGFLLPK